MGAVYTGPTFTRFQVQFSAFRNIPANVRNMDAQLIAAISHTLQADRIIKILCRGGVNCEHHQLTEICSCGELTITDFQAALIGFRKCTCREFFRELRFGQQSGEARGCIVNVTEYSHNPALRCANVWVNYYLHTVIMFRTATASFEDLNWTGNARVIGVDQTTATGQGDETSNNRGIIPFNNFYYASRGIAEASLSADGNLDPVAVSRAHCLRW
ncbi:hypothetical protein BMS3Bbin04_00822 [bacterium BMS3Bbin04]|nr:hypothetical protein BMS3Bbin04_00822 [bacterium BMS3Bbin04]